MPANPLSAIGPMYSLWALPMSPALVLMMVFSLDR